MTETALRDVDLSRGRPKGVGPLETNGALYCPATWQGGTPPLESRCRLEKPLWWADALESPSEAVAHVALDTQALQHASQDLDEGGSRRALDGCSSVLECKHSGTQVQALLYWVTPALESISNGHGHGELADLRTSRPQEAAEIHWRSR